jgi:hypothetical protein
MEEYKKTAMTSRKKYDVNSMALSLAMKDIRSTFKGVGQKEKIAPQTQISRRSSDSIMMRHSQMS